MVDPLEYVEYIRSQPCVICAKPGAYPHHIKRIGMGRDRKKRLKEHFSAIPLCNLHHSELHDKGDDKFFYVYGIELWQKAHELLVEYLVRRPGEL